MEKIDVIEEVWHGCFNFYLGRKENGVLYGADPISATLIESGAIIQPAFNLKRETVQFLFDRLYILGFRPTEEVNMQTATHLQQAHINSLKGELDISHHLQDKILSLLEKTIE